MKFDRIHTLNRGLIILINGLPINKKIIIVALHYENYNCWIYFISIIYLIAYYYVWDKKLHFDHKINDDNEIIG